MAGRKDSGSWGRVKKVSESESESDIVVSVQGEGHGRGDALGFWWGLVGGLSEISAMIGWVRSYERKARKGSFGDQVLVVGSWDT